MISIFRARTLKLPAVFLAGLLLTLPAAGQEAALTGDERNTIDVFERASKGVVHIEVRATQESMFAKQVREAGAGSGFLIDRDGRILTAFHVISGMNQIDVSLSSGRRVSARLIGTAPSLDIALLQVEAPPDELFPLPLGDSRMLRVGQKVLAIGNPIGLHNTLTTGIISALRRSVEGAPVEMQDALIQTDAAINPGNSGGPLLNSQGEVIGINNAIIANAQNVGFAVPIHFARQILADLMEMGHPYRPQLGFSGSEITPSIAKLFGLPLERGFLVEEVLPHSPAALAGLRAGGRIVIVGDRPYTLGGDIITAINGQQVQSPSQVAQVLLASRPGQILRLVVYRQGREIEISILLEKMVMQF